MKRNQIFELFYNFFKKKPNGTYLELFNIIQAKSQIDSKYIKQFIDNMRRNLQKQKILKCEKHMMGRAKIFTIKIFDEQKVEQYKQYLNKKGNL